MKRSLIASGLLLIAFVAAAILRDNLEFMFYASTLVVILGVIYIIDRTYNFSALSLWAFNLWLLLHLLGGMASIDGVRLYDYMLLPVVGDPYNILKYDQFVHAYCYIAMSMLVYEVLMQTMPPERKMTLFIITVLAASGIGAANEVIEFAAVVFFGSTGVGGYTNTALDMVMNLAGAIMGAAFKLVQSRETSRIS